MSPLLEQSQKIWLLAEHLHYPLSQTRSILLPHLIILALHDLEASLCPYDQRVCIRVQPMLAWADNSQSVSLTDQQ